MSQYGKAPVLYPCSTEDHSSAECFFVEGDSAAKTVNQVRDVRSQAVLALQGKPLNAIRASKRVASTNEVFLRIAGALLRSPSSPNDSLAQIARVAAIRYAKVVLLMDPDADGIHCGVLTMGFFRRFAPDFIRMGKLWLVRAPMYEFRFPLSVQPRDQSPVAYSPDHAAAIEEVLQRRKLSRYKKIKHRGLGSIEAPLLLKTCVDSTSRKAERLTLDEVDQAIRLFSGGV